MNNEVLLIWIQIKICQHLHISVHLNHLVTLFWNNMHMNWSHFVSFVKLWKMKFLFQYKWKNFMTWKLWVFYLKNKSYFCNSAAYVISFLYTYTVNLNLLWIKQDEKHEIWAEDIYFLNLYCLTYIHFNSMIF